MTCHGAGIRRKSKPDTRKEGLKSAPECDLFPEDSDGPFYKLITATQKECDDLECQLTPGDRVYLENPYYYYFFVGIARERIGKASGNWFWGEEGCNLIYIGDDRYVDAYARHEESLNWWREYIMNFRSVQEYKRAVRDDLAPVPEDFKITEVRKPRLPGFDV